MFNLAQLDFTIKMWQSTKIIPIILIYFNHVCYNAEYLTYHITWKRAFHLEFQADFLRVILITPT